MLVQWWPCPWLGSWSSTQDGPLSSTCMVGGTAQLVTFSQCPYTIHLTFYLFKFWYHHLYDLCRILWNHMVHVLDPCVLWEPSRAPHHHRRGATLHRGEHRRERPAHGRSWSEFSLYSSLALPTPCKVHSNVAETIFLCAMVSLEIQDPLEKVLYLHARLCNHRGQLLP